MPRKYRAKSASPEHSETVQEFWLGKYKVTASRFCEFLNHLLAEGASITELCFIWSAGAKPSGARSNMIWLTESSSIVAGKGRFSPAAGAENAPAGKQIIYRGAAFEILGSHAIPLSAGQRR